MSTVQAGETNILFLCESIINLMTSPGTHYKALTRQCTRTKQILIRYVILKQIHLCFRLKWTLNWRQNQNKLKGLKPVSIRHIMISSWIQKLSGDSRNNDDGNDATPMQWTRCDFAWSDLDIYLVQTNQLLRNYASRTIRQSFSSQFKVPLNANHTEKCGKSVFWNVKLRHSVLGSWRFETTQRSWNVGNRTLTNEIIRHLKNTPLRRLET